MTTLVIGANGQIGRQVCAIAHRQGHPIRAMIRSAEQRDWFEQQGIETVVADLEGDFASAFEGCDQVLFTAGSGPNTGPDKTRPGATTRYPEPTWPRPWSIYWGNERSVITRRCSWTASARSPRLSATDHRHTGRRFNPPAPTTTPMASGHRRRRLRRPVVGSYFSTKARSMT
ncbi:MULTISPECIES: NAD(P)H-binding protein [unclassified Halomonas]|uniref:NAD(P)H-binding protein n=1 Tax=unclassified Halomonas TaxID=2609666 RepID=UPI000C8B0E2E|nr:hypothetical protein [Halomonas sp.]